MERCARDLFDYLEDWTDRLPCGAALQLARALCACLARIHAAGVLHGDIKPENFLLRDAGDPLSVVAADFGHSERLGPDGKVAFIGYATPGWTAPEMKSVREHAEVKELTAAADMWPLGKILEELVTSMVPDPGCSKVSMAYLTAHRELHSLCQKCMSTDPSARPAAAEGVELLSRLLESRSPEQDKEGAVGGRGYLSVGGLGALARPHGVRPEPVPLSGRDPLSEDRDEEGPGRGYLSVGGLGALARPHGVRPQPVPLSGRDPLSEGGAQGAADLLASLARLQCIVDTSLSGERHPLSIAEHSSEGSGLSEEEKEEP